ncbi:Primary amine oxidase, partial [Pseudolycoriella hygida]
MKKFNFFYLCFVLIIAPAAAGGQGSCSKLDSFCSSNKQCCLVSNGKSYCNLKTKRCEALRYCDESLRFQCPFDDLSKDEIECVVDIIKTWNSFSSELIFAVIRNQEPNKKLWNLGDKAARERKAYAAVYDSDRRHLLEIIVSLDTKRVLSVKKSRDSIPPMTSSDYSIAKEVLQKDPRVIRAFERRGLNVTYASFDIWAFGAHEEGNVEGRRRVRLVTNYKDPSTKYHDWRPVEGVSGTIDIADKKIVEFIDKGNIPVPKSPHFSDFQNTKTSSHGGSSRGSAIKINGFNIKWHSWKFQYSMDPIFGLQLYHIRYIADCEERFLIYKMTLSEMFVPYGADGKTWRWRGAFDAGEYGMGKYAAPLALGKDVPVNADGNIEVSIAATGILLAKGVVRKKNDPSCIEDCQDFVNEHTLAPVHQHFFNYRIDFDIDGSSNMLTEAST